MDVDLTRRGEPADGPAHQLAERECGVASTAGAHASRRELDDLGQRNRRPPPRAGESFEDQRFESAIDRSHAKRRAGATAEDARSGLGRRAFDGAAARPAEPSFAALIHGGGFARSGALESGRISSWA
ncbi:hypothetical protein [Rohdeia mirabilis]|uniref:hypothetical protein n=1 Tax=Rohdeia mirabilis TaxID=2528008 RepID=UPI003AF4077B